MLGNLVMLTGAVLVFGVVILLVNAVILGAAGGNISRIARSYREKI
jgi:hypothetical protein